MENNEKKLGKGAIRDRDDARDLIFEDVVFGATTPLTDKEWQEGYDIEKKLNIKIPIKNQFASMSCVGQSYSYYSGVLEAVETGVYKEISAKAIYSQIFLPQGGAQFRDGAKLLVDYGALLEIAVRSYRDDLTTDEWWMRDKSWMSDELARIAKILASKQYLNIIGFTIDTFARAIKEGNGMIAGIEGINNGTWYSNEPQPPIDHSEWNHGLFFGKFGVDRLGKYIATPNSWGRRNTDELHPDGWQKLRENYFSGGGRWIFAPWTLIDKPNNYNKPNMVKIVKDQDSPAVGLFIPARNEPELIQQAKDQGIIIPIKSPGKVDWGKLKLDGKVILNK